MTRNNRILSLLLAVCMLVSMFGVLSASAAAPTALDIATIADVADDVALAFEAAIAKGSKDIDGVYYGVTYPTTLTLGSYTMSSEDYIVMAASAIYAISQNQATTTQISYKAITPATKTAKNGVGTSLNMGQYVELAERVSKYGSTTGKLPASFNRPTDGTNVYEGRMTVYSIGHLFAEVLASYKANGTLPATMDFSPVHYGEVDVIPGKPAEPEDWFAAVIDASVVVKSSIVDSKVMPGAIQVGPLTVTRAQYLYLACKVIVALNNGQTTGTLALPASANEPGNPQGVTSGRIYKYDYTDMAARCFAYIDNNGTAANCINSADYGMMHYYVVIEAMARTLAFYKSDGMLPNYVTVSSFSGTVEQVTEPTTPPVTAPTTPPVTEPTTATTPAPSEPVSNDWYTNVISAAVALESYVKEKEALPAKVTIGTNSCTYAQATYLMCQVILGLNNGQTSGELSIPTYSEPQNPSETLTAGTLQKAELLDLAQRSINFMVNNGVAANYMITSLGNMHHHGALYMYAQILSYYKTNGTLPTSLAVEPWSFTLGSRPGDATFGFDYSGYEKYLVPTNNAPSNNSTIIALAKTAMACTASESHRGKVYENPTNTYEAMWNVMEYITYHTDYEYYLNTSRGALKTWADRMGNCCDMAHLMVSISRSLGVPARYDHYVCRFSSGNEGHVFAGLYIPTVTDNDINKDGWIYADPVNNSCYLNYQSFTLVSRSSGPHIELPF